MNWALGIAAMLSLAGCAITSWLYAKAKVDAKDADVARKEANGETTRVAKEFNDYRLAREDQLAVLRGQIKGLENELLSCNTPGARTKLVNRLLQAAGGKG